MAQYAMKPYGVTFDRSRNRWKARIYVDGRTHTVGTYRDKEAAISAREVFARETFPPAMAERLTGGDVRHKMDDIDVALIRDLAREGRSQRSVARDFGVNRAWVSQVVNGRRRAQA